MKSLGRLAALYGRMERIEAAAARRAADAVIEASRARGREDACAEEQGGLARLALEAGDRSAWQMAADASEFSMLRAGSLAEVQGERAKVQAEAMSRYLASRLKTRQVLEVLERARSLAAVAEARRDQAAADDRFAARLGWTRMREQHGASAPTLRSPLL